MSRADLPADFLVSITVCAFRAGEEASAIISKLRDSMKGTIDFQSDMPDWKKFAEVFCVQNAFGTRCTVSTSCCPQPLGMRHASLDCASAGVPDTGTMIYYACATDYPLAVFAGATMLSYSTIGMVKQIAWIVALRTIATRLKSEGFGALSDVTHELDPVTKCATEPRAAACTRPTPVADRSCRVGIVRNILLFVGAVGAALIAAKIASAMIRCYRSKQVDAEAHASNPRFDLKDYTDEEAVAGSTGRSRLPTLPLTAASEDERVNAAVRGAFET